MSCTRSTISKTHALRQTQGTGQPSNPRSFLSIAAVPELPAVIVRGTAADALCHGAALAGVGVIRCDEFKKDQMVAVLTEKNEFVGLGMALAPSSSWKPGATGLFVAMTTVFMAPGTYPRGWKKAAGPRKPGAHERIALKKYPANYMGYTFC